jgi:hypothetical protein
MDDTDPDRLADDLEEEADDLERRSEKLKSETEDVSQEWQAKRGDPGVPGAQPPEGEEKGETEGD